MHIRRAIVAAAVMLTPAAAAAQTCPGTNSTSTTDEYISFLGGTLDIVSNANAFGGRGGFVRNAGGREVGVYFGARSITGGGSSILAADFSMSIDMTKSASNRVCGFAGADLVNLTDADNGTGGVVFGIGWGRPHKAASGTTTFLPFGVLGGTLTSTNESEIGEFTGMIEAGVGFKLANGLTITPSMRQSFQQGADPVIRVLAMFPLSTKVVPPRR